MSDRAEGGPRIIKNPAVEQLANEIQERHAKELAARAGHPHRRVTLAEALTEGRRPDAVHSDLEAAQSLNSYIPADVPPLAGPLDDFARKLKGAWGKGPLKVSKK